jgi:hypothetical protein
VNLDVSDARKENAWVPLADRRVASPLGRAGEGGDCGLEKQFQRPVEGVVLETWFPRFADEKVVADREGGGDVDLAEGANGEEGRGFHLDRGNAFGLVAVRLGHRLTEHCVDGPGRTALERHATAFERAGELGSQRRDG